MSKTEATAAPDGLSQGQSVITSQTGDIYRHVSDTEPELDRVYVLREGARLPGRESRKMGKRDALVMELGYAKAS